MEAANSDNLPMERNNSANIPLPEDHRIRVAREKRERMRVRLLNAVLTVCSTVETLKPAVIDDVIRHAGVSRGTFYNYFNSLDQAVAELGSILADEMTIGIYPVYNGLKNPPQRTATAFQSFLLRAIMEPAWGGFVSHIGGLTSNSVLLNHITADVRLGAESGDFKVQSIEVAADLIVGAQSEAIRRTLGGDYRGGYVSAMAGMVLRSLGVPAIKADKVAAQAFERLGAEAPGRISWWKSVA